MPLPPETERLWKRLQGVPELFDALLVGGSALAMHLGHRISEDLDFAFSSIRLPVARLKVLINELEAEGWSFQPNDNPAAEDDFSLAGMDLHDYQQDYIVDRKVKISFFTLDAANQKIVQPQKSEPASGSPRVASVPEIFDMKALVASSRSKSRDWLDLYVLMTRHGFTMNNFAEAYARAGVTGTLDNALNRITSGKVDLDDPGYATLLPDPPSLSDLAKFFTNLRDDYERGLSTKRFST